MRYAARVTEKTEVEAQDEGAVARHVSEMREALGTLTNGVWEPKKDPLALVQLFGSLSGLLVLVLEALRHAGVL